MFCGILLQLSCRNSLILPLLLSPCDCKRSPQNTEYQEFCEQCYTSSTQERRPWLLGNLAQFLVCYWQLEHSQLKVIRNIRNVMLTLCVIIEYQFSPCLSRCCFVSFILRSIETLSGFGGLVVSMLASGTQDRGFDPGRIRRIFRAKKSTACLPWGGK